MTHLSIPEPLQARFLAACADAQLDSDTAIKLLMEEFLADVAMLAVAKARDENYQSGRTLNQMLEHYGLDD